MNTVQGRTTRMQQNNFEHSLLDVIDYFVGKFEPEVAVATFGFFVFKGLARNKFGSWRRVFICFQGAAIRAL